MKKPRNTERNTLTRILAIIAISKYNTGDMPTIITVNKV
jgi:hypothetical protein